VARRTWIRERGGPCWHLLDEDRSDRETLWPRCNTMRDGISVLDALLNGMPNRIERCRTCSKMEARRS
jgi:hypothetical protein